MATLRGPRTASAASRRPAPAPWPVVPPREKTLLISAPATIGPDSLTTTTAGPRPQTLKPRLALVIVGSSMIKPTGQTQPLTACLGDRKAENVVGARPNGTLCAGCSDRLQTRGRMVRVIRFQSGFRWIGMIGSTLRTSRLFYGGRH